MTEFDSEPELPALDPEEESRLHSLLRSAYGATEIDPARHERLLLAALEDPFARPTADELVESDRLRQALDGRGDHDELLLARALSAAFAPKPRATAPAVLPDVEAKPVKERRKSNLILLRFAGGGAALAAAAAVLLAILPSQRQESTPDQGFALAQSRSTAPLFRDDWAGAASARIDRIASARSRDLRDNRYALWGVR